MLQGSWRDVPESEITPFVHWSIKILVSLILYPLENEDKKDQTRILSKRTPKWVYKGQASRSETIFYVERIGRWLELRTFPNALFSVLCVSVFPPKNAASTSISAPQHWISELYGVSHFRSSSVRLTVGDWAGRRIRWRREFRKRWPSNSLPSRESLFASPSVTCCFSGRRLTRLLRQYDLFLEQIRLQKILLCIKTLRMLFSRKHRKQTAVEGRIIYNNSKMSYY